MLVSVNNARISQLIQNPVLCAEFPFLGNPVYVDGCDCSGVRKSQLDYNRIKRAIAEMPEDRKAIFAELNRWPGFSVRWNDGARIQTTIWQVD